MRGSKSTSPSCTRRQSQAQLFQDNKTCDTKIFAPSHHHNIAILEGAFAPPRAIMYSQYDADGDTNMKEADATYSETCPDVALQVFNTAELLETILLHLPQKDILLSQRVATKWRDVVKDSIKLRRALFLEPSKAPEILGVARYDLACRHHQMLLSQGRITRVLLACLQFVHVRRIELPAGSYYSQVLRFNALVCRRAEAPEHGDSRTDHSKQGFSPRAYRTGHLTMGNIGPLGGLAPLLDDCTRRGLSCRNMLLTEPPVSNVDVILRCPQRSIPDVGCCVCGNAMFDPSLISHCQMWGCKKCLAKFFDGRWTTCPGCGSFKCHKNGWETPGFKDQIVAVVGQDAGVRVNDVLVAIKEWWLGESEEKRVVPDRVSIAFPRESDYWICVTLCGEKEWNDMVEKLLVKEKSKGL